MTRVEKAGNLKNPNFKYVGQRSALKPHVATQRPFTVQVTILTNHSPTAAPSFLIPQNKIKVTPKQRVQQNHSQEEFFAHFLFLFPAKIQKSWKNNNKQTTALQCVSGDILGSEWTGKAESCLVSFKYSEVKIWSCVPEGGNEQNIGTLLGRYDVRFCLSDAQMGFIWDKITATSWQWAFIT